MYIKRYLWSVDGISTNNCCGYLSPLKVMTEQDGDDCAFWIFPVRATVSTAHYRPQICEGYVFTRVCHSVHRGGGGGIPACIAGLQAHTQGGSWGSGLGGLQAHTQGEFEGSGLGGGSPGPHPGGKLRGLAWGGVSRPTPRGVSQHALRQTAPIADGSAAGGTHPTGMHSCLQSKLNW